MRSFQTPFSRTETLTEALQRNRVALVVRGGETVLAMAQDDIVVVGKRIGAMQLPGMTAELEFLQQFLVVLGIASRP